MVVYSQEMITASPTQLITVLALIGFEMPLACYPSLIIMNDIYKVGERDVLTLDRQTDRQTDRQIDR